MPYLRCWISDKFIKEYFTGIADGTGFNSVNPDDYNDSDILMSYELSQDVNQLFHDSNLMF